MKILHTMLRVGDLPRSIDFYTGVLGMQLLRTTDRPEQKYTLAFVGYGDDPDGAVIELTYNYGVERYELGTGSATSRSRCPMPRPRAPRCGAARAARSRATPGRSRAARR